MTEAELREHFGTIGPVTYCYLPTDRETGRPRGFAFVEFGDDSHAQDAITRLNNQMFRGRPLAVKEAQPRESRPPGAGPRPSYGGGPPAGRQKMLDYVAENATTCCPSHRPLLASDRRRQTG